MSSNANHLVELLTEAALPNIYRTNAFRILELNTDCGEMDITRRMRMIEIAQKTGVDIPAGPGKSLPFKAETDSYHFTDAVQRLHTPEQRFIDEFFWFWPHTLGDGKCDDALAALKQDDIKQAVAIWTDYANNHSVDNVSIHNLAVLSHVLALDLEMAALNDPLDAARLFELEGYWRKTFTYWNILLEHAGFWGRLEARVRAFDDPRLDSASVQSLRDSLPECLLLINARLAVQCAEQGNNAGVTRILQTMRIAEFGRTHFTDILVQALEPSRGRIKTFCKTAETRAENDAIHASEAALNLLEESRKPLQIVERLLPKGTPAFEAIQDEVALRGKECVITYVNHTDDYTGGMGILQMFAPLAVSESARSSIEENLKRLREDGESGNYWCIEGYYDLREELLAPLEEARLHSQAQDFDKAITLLDDLINGRITPLQDADYPYVRKPLARCINLQANARLTDAMDWVEHPLRGDGLSGPQTIGGYIRNADKLKEQSRANLRATYPAVYDDLLFAHDLDPSNTIITDNLDFMKKNSGSVQLPWRTSRRLGQLGAQIAARPVNGQAAVATVGKWRVASIGQHVGAWVIDYLVLILLSSLPIAVLFKPLTDNNILAIITALLPAIFYFPVMHGVFKQSVGEKVSKTQVVDKTGNPITFWRALARWALLFILYVISGIVFFLMFILPFVVVLNKKHKNLADFITNTCLVESETGRA